MRNLRLVHSLTWLEPSTPNPALLAVREAARPAGPRSSPPDPQSKEIERDLPALDPVVQSMLEQVRDVAPLPHEVRARALARARAAIATRR